MTEQDHLLRVWQIIERVGVCMLTTHFPTRGVQNVLLAFGICLKRVAARVRMLAHEHDAVTQG
jgi:hypothetical protein